jgi:hypothetical protein
MFMTLRIPRHLFDEGDEDLFARLATTGIATQREHVEAVRGHDRRRSLALAVVDGREAVG